MGVYVYGASRRTMKVSGKKVAKSNFYGKPPTWRNEWDAEDGCPNAKRYVRHFDAFTARSRKIADELRKQGVKFMVAAGQLIDLRSTVSDARADEVSLANVDDNGHVHFKSKEAFFEFLENA